MSKVITPLPDSARGCVKETTLTTYSALQATVVQHLSAQGTVLGWLIGLTGAVVGVLTTVDIPGLSQPLAVAAISGTDKNALVAVAILAATFALGVELLISYWIYQLFQIFRISRYLIKMESRLRAYLDIPPDTVLFGWNDESRGLVDAYLNPDEKLTRPVKAALMLSSVSQPVTLYLMAALGLVILLAAIIAIFRLALPSAIAILIPLGTLFLGLSVGLGVLVFMHFAMHKWTIGNSSSPWVGVFRQRKEENNVESSRESSSPGSVPSIEKEASGR